MFAKVKKKSFFFAKYDDFCRLSWKSLFFFFLEVKTSIMVIYTITKSEIFTPKGVPFAFFQFFVIKNYTAKFYKFFFLIFPLYKIKSTFFNLRSYFGGYSWNWEKSLYIISSLGYEPTDLSLVYSPVKCRIFQKVFSQYFKPDKLTFFLN